MVVIINSIINRVKEGVILKIPQSLNNLSNTNSLVNENILSLLPSEGLIEKQICEVDLDKGVKVYNELDQLLSDQFAKLDKVKQELNKITSTIERFRELLSTLSQLAETLSVILDIVNAVLPALNTILAAQVVPAVNGLTIKVTSDKIDQIKDQVKLYTALVKSILVMLKYMLPLLENLELKAEGISNQVENLGDLILSRKQLLDNCIKKELISNAPIEGTDTTEVTNTVDPVNQSLETLINEYNKNNEIKIEEFFYSGPLKTKEYNVRNISQEEFNQ